MIMEVHQLIQIKSTYSSLQEFQSSLVLGHFQQFHGSLLIWGMSTHFSDQITGEFVVLGLDLEIQKYSYCWEKKFTLHFFFFLTSSLGTYLLWAHLFCLLHNKKNLMSHCTEEKELKTSKISQETDFLLCGCGKCSKVFWLFSWKVPHRCKWDNTKVIIAKQDVI